MITLPNNSLKRLESAERCSKIISPDVASIHNTNKEILSSKETNTRDKPKSLGSTDSAE